MMNHETHLTVREMVLHMFHSHHIASISLPAQIRRVCSLDTRRHLDDGGCADGAGRRQAGRRAREPGAVRDHHHQLDIQRSIRRKTRGRRRRAGRDELRGCGPRLVRSRQ